MERNSAEIINITCRTRTRAGLYLRDGSKMAPDVEATLRQAYQSVHGTGEQEAKDWLSGLEAEGRYAKDVWIGV